MIDLERHDFAKPNEIMSPGNNREMMLKQLDEKLLGKFVMETLG